MAATSKRRTARRPPGAAPPTADRWPGTLSPTPRPRSNRNRPPPAAKAGKRGRAPGRPRTRRPSHGSAWRWRTDGWYYTRPGTKRRVPLLDDDGARIRGKVNRDQAGLALTRVRLAEQGEVPPAPAARGEW